MIDQPLLTVKRIAQMAMKLEPHRIIFHAIAGLTEELYQHTVMGRFGNGQMKLHIAAF